MNKENLLQGLNEALVICVRDGLFIAGGICLHCYGCGCEERREGGGQREAAAAY